MTKKLTGKRYQTLYSYVDAISQTGKHGNSPYGLTSYDIYRLMKKGKSIFTERKTYPRLTKEQKPKWKHMYAGFVSAGLKLSQAKRKASGILRGMSAREAMGHADELLADEKYDSDALFAMHKYFEDVLEFDWKWVDVIQKAKQSEINIEFETEKAVDNRRFAWQMTAVDGEIVHRIIYEKGKIIKDSMYDAFDRQDFKINIRELRIWE